MKKANLTKLLSMALIASLAFPATGILAATNNAIVNADVQPAATTDFGVGKGLQWPTQVNSPYIDMVEWITKDGYNINGVANLERISKDTGVKCFNLAFIQSCGTVSNNMINWGWGGYTVLSEKGGQADTQYQGLKESIKRLRALGGDVAISFGGVNGTAFWQTSQDVNVLTNTYLDIINGYGLTRIDLDIEGGAQNKTQNIANAKAIKAVQAQTGVKVVLTLPVLPSGLTQTQLDVLEAYLSNGVDIQVVNIMTMCYGSGTLLPGENYGTASIRAIDSTAAQVKDYYKKFASTDLTLQQAYAKIGTTCSIGYESGSDPIFTPAWSQLVVNHAIANNIAMTSFWSMNRDAQTEPNQGITGQYQHTAIYKTFGKNPDGNTAPVINGVKEQTINLNSNFDPMAGITANDNEDGILTSSIKVTGTVDTSKAGTYKLTYSVTDSKGVTTTASCTVTVVDPNTNTAPVISGVKDQTIELNSKFDPMAGVTATDKEDGILTSSIKVTGTVDTSKAGTYKLTYTVADSKNSTATASCTITVKAASTGETTYDLNKIYNSGDTVLYNGVKYTAQWWTKGETPGVSSVWLKAKTVNPDGSVVYSPGDIYNSGDIVVYNGKKYKALWWTTSVPGSDSSWASVS